MSVSISGLGLALPAERISLEQAVRAAEGFGRLAPEQTRLLGALYRRSGVQQRGSVVLDNDGPDPWQRQSLYQPARDAEDRGPTTSTRMAVYENHAGALGLRAVRDALAQAEVAPDQVTHLVTVSCSGFNAPGFDLDLFRNAPLLPGTARTHVGFMGCHGALNGLRVAQAYAAADPSACVLMCAVELCSLHLQYGWNPERVVTNALFADGAGAVVVRAEESPRADAWKIVAQGSFVFPSSEDAMTWRIGDNGFEMTLSPKVPDLLQRHLATWLDQWLSNQGLTRAAIGTWAVHPGGPRILSACTEALHLPAETLAVSREVLAECGNMSSPTILFILDRLQARNAPRPCVALAFGPGLVVEALLLS